MTTPDVKEGMAKEGGPGPIKETQPRNIVLYWLTPMHTPYVSEVIGNPGGTITDLKTAITMQKTEGWTRFLNERPAEDLKQCERDWASIRFYCPVPSTYRAPLLDSAFVPVTESHNVVLIVWNPTEVGKINYTTLLDPIWDLFTVTFGHFSSKMPALAGLLPPCHDDENDDEEDEDDDEFDDDHDRGSGNGKRAAVPTAGRDRKPVPRRQ